MNAAPDNLNSAAQTDELPSGTVLLSGQYTIDKTLNSGGFGITYLARDASSREVVIKECFPGNHVLRHNSKVRARSSLGKSYMTQVLRHFLKEARSLATMSHPNVVHVHQVFQENDTAYMALDLIKGNDLLNLVQMGGAQRETEWTIYLAYKLVSVLKYVHDNDVLHQDISPDNIFVSTLREPVLIDFGAARWLSDSASIGTEDLMVVKDGYSPHEFYFSGGSIGAWSDIYSLGATLYFLITGNTPIGSQARLAARADKAEDPLPPLSGNYPDYPAGFLATIEKALNVLPRQRYQTADEWLADLQPFAPQEKTDVKRTQKASATGRTKPQAQDKAAALQPAETTDDHPTHDLEGPDMAIDITGLNDITGFIGACLVDSDSGMMMAAVGGGKLDLEAASAANTEVVRAKLRAIQVLGLDDKIEDILISLGKQYHLIRPMEKTPSIFLYVALDRKTANLGMARVQVKTVEQTLSI